MKKSYFLLLAMALVLSACKPDVEACFTATTTQRTVAFSSACAIEAAAFEWEFGDGETSINANPVHTYTSDGNFAVTLKVTDAKGHPSTFSQEVVCLAPNSKFTGVYQGSAQCNPSTFFEDITAVPSSTDLNAVTFSGFFGSSRLVAARIADDGVSITIARQVLDIGLNDISGSGTGNSLGTNITLNINLHPSGSSTVVLQCTYVLTR